MDGHWIEAEGRISDHPSAIYYGPLSDKPALEEDKTTESAWSHICRLLDKNAFHVKKGVSLKDITAKMAWYHLSEEVGELLMEIRHGKEHNHRVLFELADIYNIILHMTYLAGFTEDQLDSVAIKKLHDRFEIPQEAPASGKV